AGGRVPELDRAVPAAGGQPFPVGAIRDAVDPLRMPPKLANPLRGADVPDLDHLRAGDRQVAAVGGEGQVVDTAPRAWERGRLKGPGLLESIYEWCLNKELELHRRDGVIATLLINVVKGGAISGQSVGPALGEIDTRDARWPHDLTFDGDVLDHSGRGNNG